MKKWAQAGGRGANPRGDLYVLEDPAPLGEQQKHSAALYVVEQVDDKEEARMILEMLGLAG